jgi:UDP-N-acetylglucosamine 4-epimerase
VNELYAQVFSRCYDFPSIGLRYFNVFGPRQNPDGAYAAVIPKWIAKLSKGESVQINGDGETSRDFCYVSNAVQANLLAVMAPETASGHVYNVAVGDRTSLNELFSLICDSLLQLGTVSTINDPSLLKTKVPFRPGDVRHSQASVDKANSLLGYIPSVRVDQGVQATVRSFVKT